MESGEIAMGTYESPEEGHKRSNSARGHVSLIGDDMEESSGSPTVDLNTNATALSRFFGEPRLNTTNFQPASGLDFTSVNGTTPRLNMTRRSSIQKRQDKYPNAPGVNVYSKDASEDQRSFGEKIYDWLKENSQKVYNALQGLYKAAKFTAKLIATAISSLVSQPPSMFGLDPGYTLYDEGKDENDRIVVQCAKCGVHARFNVDAALAFSIKDGIEEGQLKIKNYDPMTFDLQLGLTRKKKAAKDWTKSSKKFGPLKQEFLAVPLGPFGIPDVFTLGPQVSISAAVELSLEGQIDLLVGGTVSMAPGTLNLDFRNVTQPIEGLDVTFTPVFNVSAALTAKLEFGVPVAFEFGLDVFAGKFKKTLGFIEKPAVYVSASVGISNGPKTCADGIQLRVGADNTVSAQVFDLWERDLFNTPLYDHGIGCLSAKGFDADDVDPDSGVIQDVIDHFGGSNIANSSVKISNVAGNLTTEDPESKVRYMIIMDEAEETILVSGTDGFIYLVKTKEAYDLSAPWAYVGRHGSITADTFGRLLSYRSVSSGTKDLELAEISVHKPANMPEAQFAVVLQPLEFGESESSGKIEGKDYVFTAALGTSRREDLYYRYIAFAPVFRKTENGLRLYGMKGKWSRQEQSIKPPEDWHVIALKGSQKDTSKSPK
ncbi:hypothetical protein N7454_010087 [Penicillium verhagenii]|nr:hypothetical protein N7454_010087 [Penicillium verhagenii]